MLLIGYIRISFVSTVDGAIYQRRPLRRRLIFPHVRSKCIYSRDPLWKSFIRVLLVNLVTSNENYQYQHVWPW